ncbi:hypothetical protein OQA88_7942 [Cercophora sp. LCS_1]
MDLLETQASEIRSFLGPAPPAVGASASATDATAYSPARTGPHRPSSHHSSHSALGDNSAHATQPQAGSSPLTVNGNDASTSASKRRAEDDADSSSKQQRSKRNRYISIACNECKRRKIKCNGQSPCQRCGHLSLQCLYAPNCCTNSLKDSEEFKQVTDHVSRLQHQINELMANMTALRQETLRLAPIQDRNPSSATPSSTISSIPSLPKSLPPFRVPPSINGPTSIAFTVDVAKNTLHNMGYRGLGESADNGGLVREPTPHMSPLPHAPQSPYIKPPDPLWEFDKDEMVRLCRLHEEEVGIMYPVVSVDNIIEHAKWLATWTESLRRTERGPSSNQDEIFSDPKTMLLKIVICCALLVEEHGDSARAVRLYDSIQPTVDKMLMSEPADASRLPFLALCAGYRFLSNDEVLAWRMIGHVMRLCFELGLHRREGLEKIADPEDRRNASTSFWSSYTLDRRWSFSTGLPFVCHDDKIDPKLPLPESHPYLVAMITYSRLAAKIWKLVDYFEPAVVRDLKRGDFEELDREILAWYDSVPDEVKSGPIDNTSVPVPSGPTYNLQRLRIWTRLRLNQIRIWLFTPVLHSAISIEENQVLAHTAVDLAKETIRFLAFLNNTTNLYRRIQVFYHQFLTSALAVLFLASTHAPLHFSASCRNEFYSALELVKDMSARSFVSQRLWETVRSLKAYAPQLGLEDDRRHHNEAGNLSHMFGNMQSPVSSLAIPYSSATSRAGSRGTPHHASSSSTPTLQQAQTNGDDPSNGLRLQSEMQRLYEMLNGMSSAGVSPATSGAGDMVSRGGLTGIEDGSYLAHIGGINGGVYQHIRNMF